MASSLASLVCWTPPNCRYDKLNPPRFTIWLNILYACAGGFFTANLFYSHPILAILAQDFNVDQTRVANIPTLATAGDATGLLLIMPLADFFPRRKFTLTLMTVTVILWLGLCLSRDLVIFETLTYLSSVTTGITQIMLPLVSELSPPDRRAFNISIVGAGPTLAILLARILSGVVANYTSWRNIYWLALALQGILLLLTFLFMPDYPAINALPVPKIAKRYPRIILSILQLYYRHPVLVQCSLLSFCTFFCVASYWTTLTFLLTDAPYHYSTLAIGLFGLVGAATMVLGPVYARYIITPLGQPLFSVLVGTTTSLTGIVLGTFIGRHNIAGPVLQALLLDAGLMIEQIANRMSLHPVAPDMRNRVNTAFVSMLYLGQLVGTKASNQVYQQYGGWLASGGLNIAVIALCYVVVAARGPNATGWFGWKGGWKMRKEIGEVDDDEEEKVVQEKPTLVEEVNPAQIVPANIEKQERQQSVIMSDIRKPAEAVLVH